MARNRNLSAPSPASRSMPLHESYVVLLLCNCFNGISKKSKKCELEQKSSPSMLPAMLQSFRLHLYRPFRPRQCTHPQRVFLGILSHRHLYFAHSSHPGDGVRKWRVLASHQAVLHDWTLDHHCCVAMHQLTRKFMSVQKNSKNS